MTKQPAASDWLDKWLMDAIEDAGTGNQEPLLRYATASPTRCLSDDGTWFVMIRRHSAHRNGQIIMDANLPPDEGKMSLPCINVWRYVMRDEGGFPSWSKIPMHPDCEFTSVTWKDGKFHFEFKCLTDDLAREIGSTRRISLTTNDLTRLEITSVDSWQSKTAESLTELLKELVDQQAYTKTLLPLPKRKSIPKPNPVDGPVLILGDFMFPVEREKATLCGFISNATDFKLLWMIEIPCGEGEVFLDGETEYWRPKVYMQSMTFAERDWRKLAGQTFHSTPDDDDQPAIYIYAHEDLENTDIRFSSRRATVFNVDWTFAWSNYAGRVQTPVQFTDVTVWLKEVDSKAKAKERLGKDLDLSLFHEPEELLHPNAGPRFKFKPIVEQ